LRLRLERQGKTGNRAQLGEQLTAIHRENPLT
jgi:hypothetical protein